MFYQRLPVDASECPRARSTIAEAAHAPRRLPKPTIVIRSSWCCDWRDEAGNLGRQAPGGNGDQEKLHKSGGEEGGVEADGGGEEAPSERSGWDRPVDEGPEYVVDSSEQLGGDELLS